MKELECVSSSRLKKQLRTEGVYDTDIFKYRQQTT